MHKLDLHKNPLSLLQYENQLLTDSFEILSQVFLTNPYFFLPGMLILRIKIPQATQQHLVHVELFSLMD